MSHLRCRLQPDASWTASRRLTPFFFSEFREKKISLILSSIRHQHLLPPRFRSNSLPRWHLQTVRLSEFHVRSAPAQLAFTTRHGSLVLFRNDRKSKPHSHGSPKRRAHRRLHGSPERCTHGGAHDGAHDTIFGARHDANERAHGSAHDAIFRARHDVDECAYERRYGRPDWGHADWTTYEYVVKEFDVNVNLRVFLVAPPLSPAAVVRYFCSKAILTSSLVLQRWRRLRKRWWWRKQW